VTRDGADGGVGLVAETLDFGVLQCLSIGSIFCSLGVDGILRGLRGGRSGRLALSSLGDPLGGSCVAILHCLRRGSGFGGHGDSWDSGETQE
jgi:hypothetical protein